MTPTPGILSGIFIAPTATGAVVGLTEARIAAGRGIEGDRYFLDAGTFSTTPGAGRQITLIEQETLDAVLRESGIDLSAGRHRRNLVTRGVALADLIGRRFRIGAVLLQGQRDCPPCQHLQRITQSGVLEALKDRGGLRADIVEEGIVHIGDGVQAVV